MRASIDHLIVLVRDLVGATAQYTQLLGRAPSWRGRHPAFGTHNTLFRLENTYVELLAEEHAASHSKDVPVPATFVGEHLRELGPGLGGLAFGVSDAAALATRLRSHGITAMDPMDGEGRDDGSGSVRRWRNVFWPTSAARGLLTFGIEHLDGPDQLPVAAAQTPSPLTAVDHVVIRTASAEAAKDFYGKALGIRLSAEFSKPDWGGHFMFFRASEMNLEVIASEKAAAAEDRFWGVAYRTDDIDATQARLAAAGVAVSDVRPGRKSGTRVCTVKSHNLHVPTLLIADAPIGDDHRRKAGATGQ